MTRLQGTQPCPALGLNAIGAWDHIAGPKACTAQGPPGSQPTCPWWGTPLLRLCQWVFFLPLGPAEPQTLVRKYPGELVFWKTTWSQPGPESTGHLPELPAQECFRSWDMLDPAQAPPPVYLGLFHSVGDPQAVPGRTDCCCCFPRASSQCQGLALSWLGGSEGGTPLKVEKKQKDRTIRCGSKILSLQEVFWIMNFWSLLKLFSGECPQGKCFFNMGVNLCGSFLKDGCTLSFYLVLVTLYCFPVFDASQLSHSLSVAHLICYFWNQFWGFILLSWLMCTMNRSWEL